MKAYIYKKSSLGQCKIENFGFVYLEMRPLPPFSHVFCLKVLCRQYYSFSINF